MRRTVVTLGLMVAGPALAQDAGPVAAVAEPAAAARRFPVMAYKVVGNTVLEQADVEDVVTPFLGPDRTEADVEGARAALEQLYTQRGFATVAVVIPDQSLASSIVRIEVVEQRIGRLRITGSRYYSPDRIAADAPSVAEGRVPNLNDLQRDIVRLNQLPDRTVTPELAIGQAPNTVDVTLEVADKFPLHASVELNNRASIGTSPLRIFGSVRYDNLFQEGESLELNAQFAPERPDDTLVLSGSYLARFRNSRTTLRIGATYSDSNVGTVGGINVLGRGYIGSVRLAQPLPGGDGFSHAISGGFDYKSFRDDTLLRLSPDDPEYVRLRCDTNPGRPECNLGFRTPVEYAPLTLDYQASWFADKETVNAGVSLVFALRGIGSGLTEFDNKRFLARPNFFYLRGSASSSTTLPSDFKLNMRVQGQYTPDPLISNEEFSIGGLDSVRGYFESESIGDIGMSAQVELATPSLDRLFGGSAATPAAGTTASRFLGLDDLRLHVFADTGASYIYAATPGQRSGDWLASAGAGVRVRAFGLLFGSLDVAFPLRDGPVTQGDGSPVLRFRVGGEM